MKLFSLSLLVLLAVTSQAQVNPLFLEPTKKEADSLRYLLTQTTNDTVRMAACRDIGLFYLDINTDSALYFVEKDLPLAQKLGLKLWEADAWDLVAIVTSNQGNYVKSLKAYNEALRIAQDKACEENIWRISQFTHSNQPEFARLSMLATIQSDMSTLYAETGNYEEELNTIKSSLQTISRIKDNTLFSQAYRSLAAVYHRRNRLDSALILYKLALDYSDKSSYRKYRNASYNEIGTIYLQQNQTKPALQNFRNALRSSMEQNNKSGTGDAYILLAHFYEHIGKMDSALYYAKAGLATHQTTGRARNLIRAYNEMASIYERMGKADSALAYLREATAEKDSLLSLEKLKQLQNIGFDEQQRLYEMEIAKKELEARLRTNILLGSTFTLLVIAFFLYRNNRTKQKAKQKIEVAYDQLKATQSQLIQSEKMASLGELTAGIAHEIQNPLNFVNNFSEVNSELISEMKEALQKGNLDEARRIAVTIEENESKIVSHGKRADGIVKSMLQHSRKSTGQKEPTDINALCDEYLRLAYHGLRAKDKSFNAKFETKLDPTVGQLNVLPQEIGRVILNLINNAFYAVTEKKKTNPEGYEPTVTVSTKKTNGKVEIVVKDNGNGIPPQIKDKIFQPFFTTKPTGQGTGLGLSLSYDIIRAHGGEMNVESVDGQGCEFSIRLPG